MKKGLSLKTILKIYTLEDPTGKVMKAHLNNMDPRLIVKKYKEFIVEEFEKEGNVILKEGANYIFRAIAGQAPTPYFDEINAYIGVGDSSEPADKTQTGLLGLNVYYKKVQSGYPIIDEDSILYSAFYGSNEANFFWNELSIANGPSNDAVNLNRIVEPVGLKLFPQIRVAFITITTP